MNWSSKYQRQPKTRMPEREEDGKLCYSMDVYLEDIIVIMEYQRKQGKPSLARLIKDFSRRAVGTPVLSLQADGRFAVIDGQHRIKLLQEKGIKKWRFEVIVDLTLGEEAQLFERTNTVKPVSFNERFRSGLVYKKSQPVRINRAVKSHGLELNLGGKKAPNHIVSASALTNIDNFKIGDRRILNDFLTIFKSTFVRNYRGELTIKREAQNARLIDGMGLAVFRLMTHGYSLQKIASAFKVVSAKALLANASKSEGWGKIEAIAEEFVAIVTDTELRQTVRKAA